MREGQYVVRVNVEAEGVRLASAMAMDASVELAEDRACERAIARLQLDDPPASPKTEDAAAIAPATVPPPAPSAPPPEVPTHAAAPPAPSAPTVSPVATPEGDRNLDRPEWEPTPAPVATADRTPSDRTPSDPPPPAVTPTDDSDLLVQTTLEIRRLGWDAEQGRAYLEQTYGKRSRQQLTRDELESFLTYLQAQPTP